MILALRFVVLKSVIDEIADSLTDMVVIVPSNPVGLDAQGEVIHLLPKGESTGELVAGWLPAGGRLAMAFGPCRAISSNPPVSGHRSRRSSSTPPTMSVPVRKSSG